MNVIQKQVNLLIMKKNKDNKKLNSMHSKGKRGWKVGEKIFFENFELKRVGFRKKGERLQKIKIRCILTWR